MIEVLHFLYSNDALVLHRISVAGRVRSRAHGAIQLKAQCL